VIAAQGTASVPACAQCHAFSGASDSSGAFPRIAGQSAFYLAGQMRDFASAQRINAIMSPIAKALSAEAMGVIAKQLDDQEIAAVAAFYQQARGSAVVSK
jgi:cytochrome c553